ncbi:MAG: NTP transferase domain-containing protein [Granulosicoccus sp.]
MVDIRHCEGCYLAHSLQGTNGRIAKGTYITAELADQLAGSGLAQVLVAQLEDDDTHENDAALAVASVLGGSGVKLTKARTGRVNLLSTIDGLCHFSAQSIIAANAIDEGITIATLPENQWVAKGRMVATVKIIPYAVNKVNVQRVLAVLDAHGLSVAGAMSHRAELIQTRLSSVKEAVLDKTRRITENRLTPRAVTLICESRCDHNEVSLQCALEQSLQRNPHWILIVGASAISDRGDVIPKAIIAAGGVVHRYGIPVDPGNLLLLASINDTHIIGLPGCARSPRYNGLDMILDRMACQVPVTNSWLSSLSVGGLLEEIADRPTPRTNSGDQQEIAALILAAGSSSRAGKMNKLLAPYNGGTMISHIAGVIEKSQVCSIVAVTGYEEKLVVNALASNALTFQHNAAHQTGMASSVIAGISQLTDYDGVLVCLGDMPHITTEILDQLINAFRKHQDKTIIQPVYDNKRGNPVLFGKVFFDTLLTLEGDVGARKLVDQYPDEVLEVVVESHAVLTDYDTPQELSSLS